MYQMQQQQREHKSKLSQLKQEYEHRLQRLQTIVDQVSDKTIALLSNGFRCMLSDISGFYLCCGLCCRLLIRTSS